MKQIYVCNIVEESRFGGPQARILLVAEAQKGSIVKTHVAFSKYYSEKFERKLNAKGISHSAINLSRLTKDKKMLFRYVFFFFPEMLSLIFFLKRNNFDLVHVNGSFQLKGALAAKVAGIPVVWHLNDTYTFSIVKSVFARISKICATGFITAGQKVYNYYLQGTPLQKKPFCEIHAPVDSTVFDPAIVQEDSRIKIAKGVKILTVSNINPGKGLEYFIDMAYRLKQKKHHLNYFIGGAVFDNHMQYFKKLKDSSFSKGLNEIKFIGKLNDVASALKSADIFVFCSLAEASPTVVWEAMMMGKAIVTTDVGSVSQYIENGKSGFIVSVKDSLALSDRVEILINDKELRERMGREAHAIALKHLDVLSAAQKHENFYKTILSG